MRFLHGHSTSLAAAIFALCCGACSTTPGLKLQVTPGTIGGDGLSPITVTAYVTQGGSPVDGSMVHFTSSLGSFVGGTGSTIDVDTQAGNAVATLTAPRQGRGQIKFTASTSLGGQQPTDSATVTLMAQGGPASSLTFTCERQNIGALVSGRLTPIHLQCTAVAYDATSKHLPIPNASIETMTEAGDLAWQSSDATGKQIFVYTVDPGAPPPVDVKPFDQNGQPQDVCPAACNRNPRNLDPNLPQCTGEPCWTDPTGITHNPRDGIATLVAAVPGPNGIDDQGEPFVDADDDKQRTGVEAYIDVNGNGKYDGPSGATQPHMIWQAVRVIWSGENDAENNTAAISTISYNTTSMKSAKGKLYLNDKNLNALAADGVGGSDTVSFDSTGCTGGAGDGQVAVLPGATAMSQLPGILFNAADGNISTPGLHSTYLQHTDYDFSVTFTGTAGGNACNLTGTAARTYDPGAPDFAPDGSQTESVGTTIQF